MQKKGEINESDGPLKGKADYLIKGSAKFEIAADFYHNLLQDEKNELTSGLLQAMYEELTGKITDVDTVGIWLEYDGQILENAMKMETLDDMKSLGTEDVVPIYELFKMTLAPFAKEV
jgi:hypothetical protein